VTWREIGHFGSTGFEHSRIARGNVQVSIARLDGVIGGHEAASQQRLVVLHGRVAVSTHEESAVVAGFEAVEWEVGEWHETRSLEPSLLLIVEGEIE
jgi:hypothetical protein